MKKSLTFIGMPSSTVLNNNDIQKSMLKIKGLKENNYAHQISRDILVLLDVTQESTIAEIASNTISKTMHPLPEIAGDSQIPNFNRKYSKNIASFDTLCKALNILPNQPLLSSLGSDKLWNHNDTDTGDSQKTAICAFGYSRSSHMLTPQSNQIPNNIFVLPPPFNLPFDRDGSRSKNPALSKWMAQNTPQSLLKKCILFLISVARHKPNLCFCRST